MLVKMFRNFEGNSNHDGVTLYENQEFFEKISTLVQHYMKIFGDILTLAHCV